MRTTICRLSILYGCIWDALIICVSMELDTGVLTEKFNEEISDVRRLTQRHTSKASFEHFLDAVGCNDNHFAR